MRKLAIVNKFNSFRTFDKRPSDIPADWLIFTAPRPLFGDKTWRGGGGGGFHYAAVDPKDDYMFPIHLAQIKRMQGELVIYSTEKDFLDWVEVFYDDPEEKQKVLSDPKLIKWAKSVYLDQHKEIII